MDDLRRSLLNVFVSSDLDRAVPRRKDQDWFNRLELSDASRFIPFHDGRFLFAEEPEVAPVWMKSAEFAQFGDFQQIRVFLGMRESIGHFATDIIDGGVAEQLAINNRTFADLRQSGALIGAEEASVISYAKALFHWHRAHLFCGRCGAATFPEQEGHVRRCANAACGQAHFPRVDPAIIVAVENSGRCLFGRQPSWPKHRYSVIAGFVELGESIEQAVVREVMEETNIRVDTVKYRSSQPWPFPGSVMLGFSATAVSEQISLNDGELQDAHWRSHEEVVNGLIAGNFLLPPKLSIAYRLIEEWFNSRSDESLAKLLDRTGRHSELR